jgi:predicted Fe-S protein YdhL (DUF1289 family)
MLSPCRKICVYDSFRDLCAGCGRRLEEIENWLEMSEDEREAVIAELPKRLGCRPPRP